jgi:D-psicose/D-tagatose/L-ribulose 3-epimerase
MTRRRALFAAAAMPMARAAKTPLPLAICSETFAGLGFPAAAKAAASIGYQGIEIQPDHLAPDPAKLSPAERRAIRDLLNANELSFVGLHAFLKAPAGLHLAAPDAALRRKSWDVFAAMIDLAADLADGGPKARRPILALGSSKQRMAEAGLTPADATARLRDGLAALAPHAEKRNVKILIEPLAPHLCNVVNSIGEAMSVVRSIGSPAVQTMFDSHNTSAETESAAALLKRYRASIGHVHLNEMDGKRPGLGNYAFTEVLRSLKELKYPGWISIEVFDFKPDGETVAREAFRYLQDLKI